MRASASKLKIVIDQDGAIILDITSDRFFSLNPAGVFIWSRLTDGHGRDQIIEALGTATGMDCPSISADVDEFIAGSS